MATPATSSAPLLAGSSASVVPREIEGSVSYDTATWEALLVEQGARQQQLSTHACLMPSKDAQSYGLEPLVNFKCSPLPGGLYWQVAMMFAGYISLIATLANFVQHNAYVSAVFLGMVAINCIRVQMLFVRDSTELQVQVANSLRTGFMQPLLKEFLSITVCSKHSWTICIVAFSSLSVVESRMACLLQVASYSLSMWTIVCEDVGIHMGDELCQIGKTLVKTSSRGSLKIIGLTCWSLCHVSGSIAMAALVMKTWHPMGLLLFFPCGWVNGDRSELPLWKQVVCICTEPLESLLFSTSSVFGFPLFVSCVMQFGDPPNLGNKPAWPVVGMHISRVIVSTALLADHLRLSMANLGDEKNLFESFLVAQVLVLVPLDVVAMALLLLCNRNFREGIQNEVAAVTMLEIAGALIIFEED